MKVNVKHNDDTNEIIKIINDDGLDNLKNTTNHIIQEGKNILEKDCPIKKETINNKQRNQ